MIVCIKNLRYSDLFSVVLEVYCFDSEEEEKEEMGGAVLLYSPSPRVEFFEGVEEKTTLFEEDAPVLNFESHEHDFF